MDMRKNRVRSERGATRQKRQVVALVTPANLDLEKRMRRWKELIRESTDVRERTLPREQLYEVSIRSGLGPTPAKRLEVDKFKEYWVQKYITENYKRLGFTDIQGPRPPKVPGPDFRLKKGNRWYDAEAEVRWENYIKHRHMSSPHFGSVKYLIVLSADDPSDQKWKLLPPKIIHIDRQHFLDWYKPEGRRYAEQAQVNSRLNARMNIVAEAMQEIFTNICDATDRDMAACPNCELCPYFGDGTNGAKLVFQKMAADFIAKQTIDRNAGKKANMIDLRRIQSAKLQRYVLDCAMNGTMDSDSVVR